MDKKKSLPVRLKIIIIMVLNIVVLSILIYGVSTFLLLKSYKNIERDQAIQNVQRANDAITNVVDELGIKIADWARWDDTYKFIIDNNKTYIDTNLHTESLLNLKLNTMIFISNDKKIVFKKMIDIEKKEDISSDNIAEYILKDDVITKHSTLDSKVGGIIMLPEGPMAIVSLPILSSLGEGPIHGTLIFGKFLNKKIVDSIGQITHLSMSAYQYDKDNLPPDVIVAKSEISIAKESTPFTKAISEKIVAGYTIIKDIHNKPSIVLKIETPRDVYNQGLRTLYLFILTSIISVVAFGLIIIIFLETFLVSRLSKLSIEVEKIGKNKDFSARVFEKNNDEIGLLASSINKMLEALVISKEAEANSGKEALLTKQKLDERVGELEKVNNLMIDRELKMIELKNELEKAKSGNNNVL